MYISITYEYQWLWVSDEAKSWAASFIKAVLREAQMPPMPRLHSVARRVGKTKLDLNIELA